MEYRYLGRTGLKVSVIGLGNWINSNDPKEKENLIKCVKVAYDAGVNFFDTAEIYGKNFAHLGFGEAERQMGEALRALGVPREHYVLSTKLIRNSTEYKPNRFGLSRKHLIEGIKTSLKNLGHDHVDVLFAHRPDYGTPMEQTVKAFDWIIRHGYAHYWGTSEWDPADIREAMAICERFGLMKPVVEQPQYNLLNRQRFECEYSRLFEKTGYGTTIWSPLAGGLLTDKYLSGKATEGRYSTDLLNFKKRFEDLVAGGNSNDYLNKLRKFDELAKSEGVTCAQLSMAWCLYNKDVSVALTGASKPEQLLDSLKAVELLKRYTPELDRKIEDIFQNLPSGAVIHSTQQLTPSRRLVFSPLLANKS